MPLITREQVAGYVTCGRDRAEFGDCPGYTSEPVELILETVSRTFFDEHGDESDPYARLESTAHSYLQTVDGEPLTCRHCGAPATLSLEPRPTYTRLSDKGPDELVRLRETERAAARRSQDTLDATERQARALEQLAAQGAQAGEIDQLRETVERQSEEIARLVAAIGPEPANGSSGKPRRRVEG